MINNYPKSFIHLSSQPNRPRNIQDQSLTTLTSAPYVQGVTERVSKLLQSINSRVASKPNNTLRKILCKLKDKRSTGQIQNYVYQLQGSSCPATYIGEMSRKVNTRISEHKNSLVKHNETFSIYQYYYREEHTMD